MTIDELTALVAPPGKVQVDRDWSDAVSMLQLRFGADYLKVLDAYGYGTFRPGFTLFDPRRDDCFYVDELLELMRDPDLYADEYPFPPHPGPGRRLYPVASNGSGGFVLAMVVDGTHDESAYWLAEAGDHRFAEVSGPFSELLTSLLFERSDVDAVWHIAGPFRPL